MHTNSEGKRNVVSADFEKCLLSLYIYGYIYLHTSINVKALTTHIFCNIYTLLVTYMPSLLPCLISISQLQRLEEEAREKMRAQLEQRRAWALRRRDQNLAARAHLDAMRQSQGITDPWTFSYFVRWPKESYSR